MSRFAKWRAATGDFAMVAVAAVIKDKNAVWLGVGGMAGRPMVRRIVTDNAESSSANGPRKPQGYEDLHASAALRRDLFKNLAPEVIAEAIRCAA